MQPISEIATCTCKPFQSIWLLFAWPLNIQFSILGSYSAWRNIAEECFEANSWLVKSLWVRRKRKRQFVRFYFQRECKRLKNVDGSELNVSRPLEAVSKSAKSWPKSICRPLNNTGLSKHTGKTDFDWCAAFRILQGEMYSILIPEEIESFFRCPT